MMFTLEDTELWFCVVYCFDYSAATPVVAD